MAPKTTQEIVLRLTVQKRFFDLITSREKTVEGRLAKPKYSRLQPGDILEVSDGKNFLLRSVKKTETYPDFKTMLAKVGYNKMVPDVNNIDEALAVYHSFDDYRKNEQEKGVVAIWIT